MLLKTEEGSFLFFYSIESLFYGMKKLCRSRTARLRCDTAAGKSLLRDFFICSLDGKEVKRALNSVKKKVMIGFGDQQEKRQRVKEENRMEKEIFCFDVDNTIYSHENFQISAAVMECLEELKKQGKLVVLATGRDMSVNNSRMIEKKVKPDAVVHANGLKVTVGNRILYEHYFDQKLLGGVLDFCQKNGIVMGFSSDKGHFFTNVEKMKEYDRYLFLKEKDRFYDYKKLDFPVHALTFFGTAAQIAEVKKVFPQIFYFLFADASGADVMDVSRTKADGIECLLAHYGLTWQSVVAFGDSMNDIEMLERAGHGIAMGNAISEVKERADEITGTIGEEGVVQALKEYYLKTVSLGEAE